jgi:hypothetical protein
MSFEKGVAVEGFPFAMIDKSGDPVTSGVVSGFITKDGGTQNALDGTPEHEGNGQWSVNISAAEMTADILGLVFTHSSAVNQNYTIATVVTADPCDSPVSSAGVSSSGDITFPFYGSVTRATSYFDNKLSTGPWDRALQPERAISLTEATAIIDRLNFANDKNDVDQSLQFPRGDDADIPLDIEYATYEIAIVLLDGYDENQEVETLGILSEAYSGVRTTYDADHVNEHKRAGIPSIQAWELLKPFLRDNTLLKLSRVS